MTTRLKANCTALLRMHENGVYILHGNFILMSGVLGLVICFPKKIARLPDHPYMLTAVEGWCKALNQT